MKSILEIMTITEAADFIRARALEVAEEKGVSEQQAYKMLFGNIEKYLGATKDDSGRETD